MHTMKKNDSNGGRNYILNRTYNILVRYHQLTCSSGKGTSAAMHACLFIILNFTVNQEMEEADNVINGAAELVGRRLQGWGPRSLG